MARGWESKSVESQMESANDVPSGSSRQLTDQEKKMQRERQNLLLSRAYVQQQMESSKSDRYRQSLIQALREIEEKLSRMEEKP